MYVHKTKSGKEFKLYNPSEKSKHYIDKIKSKNLTKTQFAYYSGYLNARKEAAKIWKSKNKKAAKK